METAFKLSKLQAALEFKLVEAATLSAFDRAIATNGDAIAFIGHSLRSPGLGSVGLQFSDKYLVKVGYEDVVPKPSAFQSREMVLFKARAL